MDDIIVLLFWIGIIIFSIIKKSAKENTKKNKVEDIEEKVKDIFLGNIEVNTQKTKPVQSQIKTKYDRTTKDTWIPAYEVTSVEDQGFQNNIVGNDFINLKNEVVKKDKNIEVGNDKKLAKKNERKLNSFDGLDEDDLIKGIIFKEILDRPRALNPYRNIARR